jgi:RNA polymerase sigma-70 factor (ECF subfamily)
MSTFPGQLTGWMAPALISEMELAPAKTLDSSETITALVTEYSATLYRVAYSVMRNPAEAEDAVQEAFLRVLKHRDKLESILDHRVWLIRITWNIVLDRKRRTKTRPENDDISDYVRVLPSKDRRADDSIISSQEHNRILSLIERLPRKEREALLLSAVEELSTVQIAAVLGTTESSVRSRIFRARRQLSSLLEMEGVSR